MVGQGETESPLDAASAPWHTRAQAGGRAVFDAYYAEVAPAVYAWARLRLRREGMPDIEPEDLVQEVWLRAYRAIERVEHAPGPFRLWVFHIAKLVLLELVRERRSHRPVDLGSHANRRLLDSAEDPATTISRRIARDEALARFVARLTELPELEQRLVTYCGFEGASYADVARRLEMTTEAVARRWQRLRARLVDLRMPAMLLDAEYGA